MGSFGQGLSGRPSFIQYLLRHHKRRLSLQDRVESELKSLKLFFAEPLVHLEIRSKMGRLEVEEYEDKCQLNSFACSREKHDRQNRRSRRQLCYYIQEALCARRIVYPDPQYFLNNYQYDRGWEQRKLSQLNNYYFFW